MGVEGLSHEGVVGGRVRPEFRRGGDQPGNVGVREVGRVGAGVGLATVIAVQDPSRMPGQGGESKWG